MDERMAQFTEEMAENAFKILEDKEEFIEWLKKFEPDTMFQHGSQSSCPIAEFIHDKTGDRLLRVSNRWLTRRNCSQAHYYPEELDWVQSFIREFDEKSDADDELSASDILEIMENAEWK